MSAAELKLLKSLAEAVLILTPLQRPQKPWSEVAEKIANLDKALTAVYEESGYT